MSSFIKSLDSNHLVRIGDEGFLWIEGLSDDCYDGSKGIDWVQNLDIETIDFGIVHL